jgi:hypothetical protein
MLVIALSEFFNELSVSQVNKPQKGICLGKNMETCRKTLGNLETCFRTFAVREKNSGKNEENIWSP